VSAGARPLADKALSWLRSSAVPLWLRRGFDEKSGAFEEAFSADGKPLPVPRRAMVQARQIYSSRVAAKLGCLEPEAARTMAARVASGLIARWGLPSGAFVKSVDAAGKVADPTPDLYTQAFAIFGLANAQRLAPDPALERRALAVAEYLRRERRAPGGGYTELENGAPVLRSNPHMHLYEAALAWLEAGGGPAWAELADEILELCLTRFIDPESGGLAEDFVEGWRPERGPEGFYFQPGHHYEWAWLMRVHQELRGRDLSAPALALYRKADAFGLGADGFAYDEVWSTGSAKSRASRFWPQGERCKAACRLGAAAPAGERAVYARSADQALGALLQYLDRPAAGLWSDWRNAEGEFAVEPARASALYHIVNAIDEYLSPRAHLDAAPRDPDGPFLDPGLGKI
jgi:mannose-6-phosphate isomerase